MHPRSYAEKHYQSAHTRLFKSVMDRFLSQAIPQLGPELIAMLRKQIISLFDEFMYTRDRVSPGQMVWVAIDKNTRADSKHVKYKPIVLTLVDEHEINELVGDDSNGKPSHLLPKTIARICEEAYSQGALLSMRDIALILKRASSDISVSRKKYETQHEIILPTPASLQDMGSGATHKIMIIKKVLIEKKDMAKVRSETKHTQWAIDKYLKEYRRIEILLKDNKSVDYIAQVTNIRPFVVKQYEKIFLEVNSC